MENREDAMYVEAKQRSEQSTITVDERGGWGFRFGGGVHSGALCALHCWLIDWGRG